MFNGDYMDRLHDWVLHKCDLIVASPCHNQSIMVKDNHTGEKKRMQKHFVVTSIRELHNELIKP